MSQQNLKMIFFGTSRFARVVLDKLIKDEYNIETVVTQPDKPTGRKKIMMPSPVKTLAIENKIVVFQPEKLDYELINGINKIKPDLIVTVDYGKIIPEDILNIPKFGSINIHPSILPKYRGPSPIQYSLLNGDKETGIAIMKMDDKMDHGDIILDFKFKILDSDTYVSLSRKLAYEAANKLSGMIPDYIAGKTKPRKQNHSEATYTKKIEKEDGLLDFNKTAEDIYNQWRAYIEWPGIYGEFKAGVRELDIKLIEILPFEGDVENKKTDKGELFVENKKLIVKCAGDTYLEIIKLQPEGKKVMSASSFINGYIKRIM